MLWFGVVFLNFVVFLYFVFYFFFFNWFRFLYRGACSVSPSPSSSISSQSSSSVCSGVPVSSWAESACSIAKMSPFESSAQRHHWHPAQASLFITGTMSRTIRIMPVTVLRPRQRPVFCRQPRCVCQQIFGRTTVRPQPGRVVLTYSFVSPLPVVCSRHYSFSSLRSIASCCDGILSLLLL